MLTMGQESMRRTGKACRARAHDWGLFALYATPLSRSPSCSRLALYSLAYQSLFYLAPRFAGVGGRAGSLFARPRACSSPTPARSARSFRSLDARSFPTRLRALGSLLRGVAPLLSAPLHPCPARLSICICTNIKFYMHMLCALYVCKPAVVYICKPRALLHWDALAVK